MTYNVKVGSNTIDLFNVIERYNNTTPSNFSDFSPVVWNSNHTWTGKKREFFGFQESGTTIAGYHVEIDGTHRNAHRAYTPSGINNGYVPSWNEAYGSGDSMFVNSWAAHRVHNNTTSETKYLPTGCNKVTFFLGGGGGGGGGTGNSGNRNWGGGGGGGGGGVVLAEGIPVTGKANNYYNVVAGAAGAGATARGSGSDGGTSSFHFINKQWSAGGGNGGGTGYEKSGYAAQGNGGGGTWTGLGETEVAWTGNAGTAGNTDYYGSVGGHYNWNSTNDTHGNHLRVYSTGGATINNNANGSNANYYGGGGGGSGGNNQSQNEDGKGGNGSQGVVIVHFRYD